MPTGENSTTPGSDAYEWAQVRKERERHAAQQRQGQANALRQQFMQGHNANVAGLDTRREQGMANIAATRDNALKQMMERQQAAKVQADRVLAQPAPSLTGQIDLAPLQSVTGVALNGAMSGANAASSQFYVSPDSTASSFAVGAPIGGGGLGQRTKQSTQDISGNSSTFGNARKGEF